MSALKISFLPMCFLLALRQMFDPQILRILLKSIAVSLAIFVILGAGGWYAIDGMLASGGLDDSLLPGVDGLRGVFALAATLVGLWLLWRIVAMAVVQFYADYVVAAVEARYYGDTAKTARQLPLAEQLRSSLRAAGRALIFNLLALPIAGLLLVTGVGTALVFLLVNAVLLGRELQDMVWTRYQTPSVVSAPPVGRFQRFCLGGIAAVLLTIPGINLLAPVLGAAASTHLVHRNMKARHDTPR